MTAKQRDSSPESKYFKPLSLEFVLAGAVALINLALDQADKHIPLLSWFSVIACVCLLIDGLRRTEWIASRGVRSRQFVLTSLLITAMFSWFGWYLLRTSKPAETVRQFDQVEPSFVQSESFSASL